MGPRPRLGLDRHDPFDDFILDSGVELSVRQSPEFLCELLLTRAVLRILLAKVHSPRENPAMEEVQVDDAGLLRLICGSELATKLAPEPLVLFDPAKRRKLFATSVSTLPKRQPKVARMQCLATRTVEAGRLSGLRSDAKRASSPSPVEWVRVTIVMTPHPHPF